MKTDGPSWVDAPEVSASLREGHARVLEMIATDAPLADTLDALARVIESQVDRLRCSIVLLDDDGVRLRHGASPSLPPELVRAIDGLVVGADGAAFLENRLVATDLAVDARWEGHRDLLAHGVRACWSTPIRSASGKVLGTFALHCREPRGPTEAEDRLVELGVRLAAIAIERKRAEEALRASEEKYRTLYHNTPVMMHSIDRRGRLLSVSRAWLDALGYDEAEVIGRPSVDFLTPSSKEYATKVILPAFFQTGACKDVQYQFVKKNGEVMEVVLSATAERDPDGSIARSLAVLIDVTELRRLEERLRDSQKMEALWRLAGGVAHDFNNLLAAILGNCEVLRHRAGADSPLRDGLAEIQRSVERGAALTRQLLAFSRKHPVEPKVIDVNDVLRSMDEMLRRLIPEHIRLVTSPAPAPQLVKADRNQLEQVVLNLAINARDAMPDGGRLELSTAEVAGSVSLSVRDTGRGMDEATRARLFEPFFTTKGPGKGTCLGLATVDGIVRQCGGQIRVESEPGRGSTFEVILPRASEPRSPEPEEKTLAGAARVRTILLVEDDAPVRRVVRALLRESGHSVIEAQDGEAALKLASEHAGAIDLLITDAVMPGMSGGELATRLWSIRPDLRVIFISGYVGDAVLPRDAGKPSAFLSKPFTERALNEKVREILQADRA